MRLSYDRLLQTFPPFPRASSRMARYGVAIMSSATAVVICFFLDQALSGNVPLTIFIIPVAVSALLGGLRAGLLASLLCVMASPYFLTGPHHTFISMDTADWERLTLFLTTSGLLIWLFETARIARQGVEARALEAEQKQSELEAQIVERERARAEREGLIAELETERARLKASVEEEKRARESLRINQERLNLAQKASRAGSFEWNLQTNAVIWSEETEAIFGLSPGSFGGSYKDWTRCLHPEDLSRAEQELQRALVDGAGNSEYRVIWPDGSLRWIQARGKVFCDEAGQPLRWVGINIDVTERKRLEESLRRQTEALREADRRKDDFLAILAHELRNPLAPISNAVQILALRGDDPAVVAQTSELMDRQVHQITRLVDDLLEVSRVGRGKISLQKSPVDLARVVATAIETSRPLIEAHRHTLTVSLPERPARVEADAARLAQVLSNLLNNAAKYTEDGGRIDLIAAQANGEVTLRVRDNGIGIAPEMLPYVFDMFAQIEGRTDRSQGGLGIGLTLARRLVEMQGGKIEARSGGPGMGSEFLISIPEMVEPAPESIRDYAKDSSAQVATGSRRVLVVDDNEDSAESMAVLLRLQGHEVRLAYDGLAALEEAQSFRPELIFLDLDLPKMDGYEVARRLHPAMKGVTLVAMTGYGQEEDRQRTLEAGFDLHLVKPLDFDRLEELLSLPADQIGQYMQSLADRGLAERQSDPDADQMERRGVGDDVIAEFQPQSDAIYEPPIHTPADIDCIDTLAASEQQRISTGHERNEFA
jgi:PAS domain S-box-containing protein